MTGRRGLVHLRGMELSARRIMVVGSLNLDLVVQVERLPLPGETTLGGQLLSAAGGKGANQAVAAARLGAAVSMVGRVGRDTWGRLLVQTLRGEGVDTRHVRRTAGPSGVALITVDRRGENCIAVAPGANAALQPSDLPTRLAGRVDSLVVQLETPLPTVEAALQRARAEGVWAILNAAPALEAARLLLDKADVLIVNERELAALLGTAGEVPPGEEAEAARELRRRRDQTVVVTLGARGAVAVWGDRTLAQPSWPVTAVDTTAAGDAFVAAFARVYDGPGRLVEALRFACAAGALTTTRPGAQPSLPSAAEVAALCERAPTTVR